MIIFMCETANNSVEFCNDNEQQGDSSLFCFSGISGILIDDVTI